MSFRTFSSLSETSSAMWSITIRGCVIVFISALTVFADDDTSNDVGLKPSIRRPVALALVQHEQRLVVGNQRSGTLSILDTETHQVIQEVVVAQKLSDLAMLPDGMHLLVADEMAHELILLRFDDDQLQTVSRHQVAPYPVSISVSQKGDQCYVASLWSHAVTVVGLTDFAASETTPTLESIASIKLPFPPRKQLLLDTHDRLVVADSFGGQLAVININTQTLESARRLPAHNIRGIALSEDKSRVFISQQILNELARAKFDDLHWGVLMTNVLRHISVETLLNPTADLLDDARTVQLGDVGSGTGDPAELANVPDGQFIVALAGVNQVAVTRDQPFREQRISVGARPTAILVNDDQTIAYVANTHGDSVSVVDLQAQKQTEEVSLGPSTELTAADRGELLFFDARLSHDHWMSCHSCHSDGHTNSLLNDNLGDGSYGAPKKVLSLLGVSETAPWAWNGNITRLEDQIAKSFQTTMQGPSLSEEQIADVAAFLNRLPPPPNVLTTGNASKKTPQHAGAKVFRQLDCARCHAPSSSFTSPTVYDVGLHDELGNQKFNPPSLRGLQHRERFFHDNRAQSLEEVFTVHRHQLDREPTDDELQQLVEYLRSL